MNELEQIKEFSFEEYDRNKVEETFNSIKELQDDADVVWSEWIKSGMNFKDSLLVDFEFYSADEKGSNLLKDTLEKLGYKVTLKSKRCF